MPPGLYISQSQNERHGGTNHILHPILNTSSRDGEYQSRKCSPISELARVQEVDVDVQGSSSCAGELLVTRYRKGL